MNRLDAMLQPGEATLWRRDRRVTAGPVWAYLVAALPVAVLGVMFTAILWHVEMPAAIMVLAGLALLFPASMAFLAWADEWLPWAFTVTDSRILWAGSRASSRGELSRAAIVGADLFEASGAVDLHLADGGIRAVNGIDDAESFVRALDVPTRVWRQRPQPAAPRSAKLAYYAIFAVGFAGPYLSRFALEFATGDRLPGAFERQLFVVGTLALCFAAIHGLYLASHRLAMWRLTPEEARRYRCWHLDRRCRGFRGRPETGGPPWVRFEKWYTGLIARQAYGGEQDCDCAPETFGPGGEDDNSELDRKGCD